LEPKNASRPGANDHQLSALKSQNHPQITQIFSV
jgi:hypothetical protein